LTCALWSLMLFALHRDQQRSFTEARLTRNGDGTSRITGLVPVSGESGHDERPLFPLPWRSWGLWWILRRTLVVVGLGLLLFLLTPRFGNQNWNLLNPAQTRGQMETGYSPTMDLNQTGEVKVSDEEAFQVKVEKADGQPKLDLDPQQRWRGTTLDLYDNGRWGVRRRPLFGPWGRSVYPPVPEGGRDDLPNLGPDAYFITFNVDYRRSRGLLLAEPVAPPQGGDIPVRILDHPDQGAPHYRERDHCLGSPPERYP